jgi:hypothetical protein
VRALAQRAVAAVAAGAVAVDEHDTLVTNPAVALGRVGEPDLIDTLAAVVALVAAPPPGADPAGGDGDDHDTVLPALAAHAAMLPALAAVLYRDPLALDA